MIKSPEAAQWSRAPQTTRFLPKRRCKDAPLCPLPAVRGTPLLHILLRNPLLLLLFLFVSSLSFLHSLPLVLFSFLIFFSFPLPPLLAIRVPPLLPRFHFLPHLYLFLLPPSTSPPSPTLPPLPLPVLLLSPLIYPHRHPLSLPSSSYPYPILPLPPTILPLAPSPPPHPPCFRASARVLQDKR